MCSGRFGAQVLPVQSWLSLLAEVTQIKPDSVCVCWGEGGADRWHRCGHSRRQKRGRVKEPHGDKKGREERGEETGITKEAEAGEKRA